MIALKERRTARLQPVLSGAGHLLSALCIAAALVLLQCAGADPLEALLVWAAAAAAIWLPGVAVAAWMADDAPEALHFPLELTLGSALFALVTVLASALHAQGLVSVWCALALLGLAVSLCTGGHRFCCNGRNAASTRLAQCAPAAALRQLPGRVAGFLATPEGIMLGLIAAVLTLLNAVWALRYAHPLVVGSVIPSQDFFWNLGNTESFLLGFPLADLRVDSVTVTYHFLTELYEAGLAMLLPMLAPYDIVAFYAYGPVAAALVGCFYALGCGLWGAGRSGAAARGNVVRALALAAMPLWLCCTSLWKTLAGGQSRFGNSVALHVLSNINGQATAFVFLASFLLFFARLCGADFRAPLWVYGGAGLAFYLLAFAKSPQAGILALAVACVCGLLALRRGTCKKGLLALAVLIPLGFLVLYRFWFAAGAGSSMRFSLTGTLNLYFFSSILAALQVRFAGGWQAFLPLLWLAQSLLMAPAAFLVWAGTALQDAGRLTRVPGSRLLWHACTVGGLLAFYLFDHYSSSQIYFASLALFCMGLLLLDRLPDVWAALSGWWPGAVIRAVLAALAAAGCGTLVCLVVWLGTSGRALLDGSAAAADTGHVPLTAAEETACEQLAARMPEDALFATNRMHTGAALEGLSNVYSGLTGRRAYMESFKYAVSNMGERAGDVMAHYALMEELFCADTPEPRVKEICAQCGISYLIYCPASPGSDVQLAFFERVYQDESITVYWVDGTAPTNKGE